MSELRNPTGPQRQHALRNANAIRLERAQLLRELYGGGRKDWDGARGRATVMLRGELPPAMRTCSVLRFLMALPTIGEFRALNVIGRVGCHQDRHLGELTERQIEMLLFVLHMPRSRGQGWW